MGIPRTNETCVAKKVKNLIYYSPFSLPEPSLTVLGRLAVEVNPLDESVKPTKRRRLILRSKVLGSVPIAPISI